MNITLVRQLLMQILPAPPHKSAPPKRCSSICFCRQRLYLRCHPGSGGEVLGAFPETQAACILACIWASWLGSGQVLRSSAHCHGSHVAGHRWQAPKARYSEAHMNVLTVEHVKQLFRYVGCLPDVSTGSSLEALLVSLWEHHTFYVS